MVGTPRRNTRLNHDPGEAGLFRDDTMCLAMIGAWRASVQAANSRRYPDYWKTRTAKALGMSVAGKFLAFNLHPFHRSEMVFGMLVIIFRCDPVPGQSLGAGQYQIAFIVSLGVLRVLRLGTGRSRRFVPTDEPGFSWHCVGHNFHIRVRLRLRQLDSQMDFMLLRMPLKDRAAFS